MRVSVLGLLARDAKWREQRACTSATMRQSGAPSARAASTARPHFSEALTKRPKSASFSAATAKAATTLTSKAAAMPEASKFADVRRLRSFALRPAATPPRVARRSSSGDGDLTGCAAELLASRCRSGGALAYHSADDDNAATTMRMEGLT